MASLSFEVADGAADSDLQTVDRGLHAFNVGAARLDDVRPVVVVVKVDGADLVGGTVGRTWGECCELQQIWVAEGYRGRGLGRELMSRFEEAAAARGCTVVFLETFSFQAPEFYARLGYATAWELSGFPEGISKLLLQKSLAPLSCG